MICSYSYFEEIDSPANRDFVARFKAHRGEGAPALNELAARAYERRVPLGGGSQAGRDRGADAGHRSAAHGHLLRRSFGASHDRAQDQPRAPECVLAELKDQAFNILEVYEDQPPTDTLLVCDLVADPNQSVFKFENGLEAAGIKM